MQSAPCEVHQDWSVESGQVIPMLSQMSHEGHMVDHVTEIGPNHLPLVYRWADDPLASNHLYFDMEVNTLRTSYFLSEVTIVIILLKFSCIGHKSNLIET